MATDIMISSILQALGDWCILQAVDDHEIDDAWSLLQALDGIYVDGVWSLLHAVDDNDIDNEWGRLQAMEPSSSVLIICFLPAMMHLLFVF